MGSIGTWKGRFVWPSRIHARWRGTRIAEFKHGFGRFAIPPRIRRHRGQRTRRTRLERSLDLDVSSTLPWCWVGCGDSKSQFNDGFWRQNHVQFCVWFQWNGRPVHSATSGVSRLLGSRFRWCGLEPCYSRWELRHWPVAGDEPQQHWSWLDVRSSWDEFWNRWRGNRETFV